MKNKFPLDNTRSAACCRAEAIISLYPRSSSPSEWQETLTTAIADLAILAEAEAALSQAEARAEGDPCGGTGLNAEAACEEGAAMARDVIEEERMQAEREVL